MDRPASPAEPLLAVRDLRTEFALRHGAVHAVNGVSFDIADGELVGLVGETGCGKSVTARSILGLLPPSGRIVEGSARFGGQDLIGLSTRDRRAVRGTGVSFVPQNPWAALNPVVRIERQFANVLRTHRRMSRAECREITHAALQEVGIAGPERVMRGYVHQLSGGTVQRVVIALALVLQPRLVIADEPTTGLDVTVQRQILDLIATLLAQGDRAMLLVTHDLGIVAQYCQRVMVMYAGRIIESGPVDQIFTRPWHPYTRALLDAIPREGHAPVPLGGTLPDLVDYPTGCAFAERCAYVHAVDADVRPELRPAGGAGHLFACHLEGGVSAVATLEEDACRS